MEKSDQTINMETIARLVQDKLAPLQAKLAANREREAAHLLIIQDLADAITVLLWQGRPDDPNEQQRFANSCCMLINKGKDAIRLSPEADSVNKILAVESPELRAKREKREALRSRFKRAYDTISLDAQKNNPAGGAKKRN